jgi:hypothetical protein
VIDYRTHLRNHLAIYAVPNHLREGLVEYLAARRPTGSFLRAVLSNDLKDAALRADDINEFRLVALVRFLVSCAPGTAWGSPEAVTAWLADPSPAPEIFE